MHCRLRIIDCKLMIRFFTSYFFLFFSIFALDNDMGGMIQWGGALFFVENHSQLGVDTWARPGRAKIPARAECHAPGEQ